MHCSNISRHNGLTVGRRFIVSLHGDRHQRTAPGQLIPLIRKSFSGLRVAQNIIPTFTLVYVGLKNTVDTGLLEIKLGTGSSNRALQEGTEARGGEFVV